MNINQICMNCMSELNGQDVCPNCHVEVATIQNNNRHLPVKTIIKGKYLVGKVLGEGGFGITYIGYDLDLQIPVAIKEFCPVQFAGRENTDRVTLLPFSEEAEEVFEKEKDKFIYEARRLARFRREPGVVSVQDYFLENGTAYIVMDYIDGVTLRKYLGIRKELLTLQELLELLKPLMKTLDKIHQENIIHRDISPDNIMISSDAKSLYLIDFGTARDFDSEHSRSVYQKGGYTPAEQCERRGNQGPWTDVYALCATIYYSITGRNIPEAVSRLMEDDLIPPSKFGIDISPAMEDALLRGLAVKPADRIQSVSQLMKELEESVNRKEEKKTVETKSAEEKVAHNKNNELVSKKTEVSTVPVDKDGNVDVEALQVSDNVRAEVKKMKDKMMDGPMRVLWGIIFGVSIVCGLIFSISVKEGIPFVAVMIMAILDFGMGLFIYIQFFKAYYRKYFFSKQVDESIVLIQINEMITEIFKNGDIMEVFWGTKIYKSEILAYYKNQILPATNVSQELKDAWVQQAKVCGIWKD